MTFATTIRFSSVSGIFYCTNHTIVKAAIIVNLLCPATDSSNATSLFIQDMTQPTINMPPLLGHSQLAKIKLWHGRASWVHFIICSEKMSGMDRFQLQLHQRTTKRKQDNRPDLSPLVHGDCHG